MTPTPKRILRTLSTVLGWILLLLLIGVPLSFLLFLALLSGLVPLYVLLPLLSVAAAGILALLLRRWCRPGPRGRCGIAAVFALVCLGAAVWMGWGIYCARLPTLDDRTLLLQDYQPFAPHSRAAVLEEPATLQWDEFTARHLRLDGATALYPVYAAFVQAVWPEGEYPLYAGGSDSPYAGLIACTNTVNAYERLMRRETDLIFAAAPSADQLAQAEALGVTLHLTPIGREAFVFFVNSRNPVTGLSVEEIQGIYSGKITNWSQVGGRNQSIRAYQRVENSGSQTALQALMADQPLMEPEQENRISAMDGIIRSVADYRNFSNAIGFSFRFYATELVTSQAIRLLALDGVYPTQETIRDGTYPLSSYFYAVTAAPIGQLPPQETDETLHAFLTWICSPQGQSLVEQTGYVGLSAEDTGAIG